MRDYSGGDAKSYDKHIEKKSGRGGKAIEYGIQGPDQAMSGERRERSDHLGMGDSMDGTSGKAIVRGATQFNSSGAINTQGEGGREYATEGKQHKGLYDAQKSGLSNGVVGNKMSAKGGSGSKGSTKPAGGSAKTGTETKLDGGVHPAQTKGYKGRG